MPPCMAFSNENPLASSSHDNSMVVVQQVQPHSGVPGVVIYTQRILVPSAAHLFFLSLSSAKLSNKYNNRLQKKSYALFIIIIIFSMFQ